MVFTSYTMTAAQTTTASTHVSEMCGTEDTTLVSHCIARALATFNAEVCLAGQTDGENPTIDDDTVLSVIVPIACGYCQQNMRATTAQVSAMSEGDGRVEFATVTYSTDIKDYSRFMGRYRRLRSV